jgi:tripartite-type tricarboxylate transporter receptor subunit TctC
MLLIHPSVPAKSVKELVTIAKKQPGKLSFASAGNGTGGHLSGELFKMLAGVDLLHVPYKGVQPALLDVVSGQVSMTFASIISAMPQVKNNRLRALAVTGGQRSPAAKELPTMIEAGVKGYESATWYGLLAPAGTPADIVSKLNTEVVAILKNPEMHERLSREGADPVGNSPAEFAKYIQSEIEKWRKVIKAAGIQPS